MPRASYSFAASSSIRTPPRGSPFSARTIARTLLRNCSSSGDPVDEPRRVDGPRRFPGIADAGGMAHRRLGSGGRIDVVARVREEMSELTLDAGDNEVARSSLRRGEEGVLRASRALERARDLVLRREDGRVAEVEFGEHQWVAGGVLLRDLC